MKKPHFFKKKSFFLHFQAKKAKLRLQKRVRGSFSQAFHPLRYIFSFFRVSHLKMPKEEL